MTEKPIQINSLKPSRMTIDSEGWWTSSLFSTDGPDMVDSTPWSRGREGRQIDIESYVSFKDGSPFLENRAGDLEVDGDVDVDVDVEGGAEIEVDDWGL